MRVLAATLCLSAAALVAGCDSGDDTTGPVANNDSAQTGPGQAVTINVLANDTGGGLTIESFRERSSGGGTVSKTDNERLTYRPRGGFLGTDSFTYVAQSASGETSKNATVTVTVQ